jgi:hypothetical protein
MEKEQEQSKVTQYIPSGERGYFIIRTTPSHWDDKPAVELPDDAATLEKENRERRDAWTRLEQELEQLRAEHAIVQEQLACYSDTIKELQGALRSRDDPSNEPDELERLKKRLANVVVAKTENAHQHHQAIAQLKKDALLMQRKHKASRVQLPHRIDERDCCRGFRCDATVVESADFIMTLMREYGQGKLCESVDWRRKCDSLANTLDSWDAKRLARVVPRDLLEALYTISGEWENGKPLPHQQTAKALIINHAPVNDGTVTVCTVDNQC